MKAIYLINNYDKKNPVFFVAEIKEKVNNFVNVIDDTIVKHTILGFNDAATLQKALNAIKTKVNFTDVNIAKQKITVSSNSVAQKLSKQGQMYTVIAILLNEKNERVGVILVDDKGKINTMTTDKLINAMDKKSTNITNMYVRDGALVLYDTIQNIPTVVIGERAVENENKDIIESNGDLVEEWTIGGTDLQKDIAMIKNQPDKIRGKLDKNAVWKIFDICKPLEIDLENGNYSKLTTEFVKNLMPYKDILDNYSEVSFDKVQSLLKKFIKEAKDKSFLDDYHMALEKGVSYKDVLI